MGHPSLRRKVISLAVPGRVVCEPIGDDEWPWYWHAFVGEARVNGGVCLDYRDGLYRGRAAIERWREADFIATHYYDEETCAWYEKGTLPPV